MPVPPSAGPGPLSPGLPGGPARSQQGDSLYFLEPMRWVRSTDPHGGFGRVLVGDVTNASRNEAVLREAGIRVEILEDGQDVAPNGYSRAEKPPLGTEAWQVSRADEFAPFFSSRPTYRSYSPAGTRRRFRAS